MSESQVKQSEKKDDPGNYQTTSLMWRIIYKPEVILFSVLPAIAGFFVAWYKTGYINVLFDFAILTYIFLLLIVNSSLQEILFLNSQLNKPKEEPDNRKKKDDKETELKNTDDPRMLFVRLNVMKIFLPGIVGLLALSSWFFNCYGLIITVVPFLYFVFMIPTYSFVKNLYPLMINEIVTLIYWSVAGLFFASYASSSGMFYKEFYPFIMPILFSALIYIIFRYPILKNKVYIVTADDDKKTEKSEKKEEQATSKRSKEPEVQPTAYFAIDENGYYLAILFFVGVSCYMIVKNIFVNLYIGALSCICLLWLLNFIKLIIYKDYQKKDYLLYMFRSSKIIYLILNASIVGGLIIEYLIVFKKLLG